MRVVQQVSGQIHIEAFFLRFVIPIILRLTTPAERFAAEEALQAFTTEASIQSALPGDPSFPAPAARLQVRA